MATHDKTTELFNLSNQKEIYDLKPHPQTGRLIDSHPGKRSRPMRVLCLGMSRTGTMSLYTAMHKLGYRVYHMNEAVKAPKTNFGCWNEALLAKFHGQGKKFGRAEFDKILGEFDACADVPCQMFAEDLIEAYPEALVVLNGRDVDKWMVSMQGSVGLVLRWHGWSLIAPWDPALVGPWYSFTQLCMIPSWPTQNDFSPGSPARQAFLDHYQHVRDITPKERFLEYRVQEGWEPLCKFIGQKVPDEPFPRVNDTSDFIRVHRLIWWLALGKMVLKISAGAVPVAAAGYAFWRGGYLGRSG